MIDGHTPITVGEFNGLFDRGDDEGCPIDHFIDEQNLGYGYRKCFRRDGSSLDTTAGVTIKRWHIYNRTGEAARLLILDTTGKLWDSAVGFVTPILDIPAMVDFSMTVLSNRAYITPHDRNRGIPNEVVYVYQGSGTARAAAGVPPSGFTLGVATSASAGRVEEGSRIFAVVFETDTGYVTAPGPSIFSVYAAPGDKAIDFSDIPLGPAGTVARTLISTALLPTDFDGNQLGVEYFFIPGATISDNTTTVLNGVSFYDSELVLSADYLFDQLSTIPAGVGIGKYKGSLVVWGSNAADRLIYISDSGKPESIDGVDNVIEVRDDGAGGVKFCQEFRDNLFIHKSRKSYVTEDNGAVPALWIVHSGDESVGTDCFGVGEILDSSGSILDYYVIADRTALRLMDGTFKTELTWKVENLWSRINKAHFSQVQICVDPTKKKIYCSLPLDAATAPSHVLVGDFSEGLDPIKIKWSEWSFPTAQSSIGVDINFATQFSVFKFSVSTNVYKIDAAAVNDFGTVIPYHFRTAFIGLSESDGITQFVAARLRAKGIGTLQLTIYGLDDLSPVIPNQVTLGLTPGRPYTYKFDYQGTMVSFKFTGGFNSGDTFTLNKMKLFGSELWLELPGNP